MPLSIDHAQVEASWEGFLVNSLFLTLFAAQHTIMVRQPFKDWLSQWITCAAERSTFVFASSLVLIGLVSNWHSYNTIIWDLSDSSVGTALTVLSIAGFVLGVYASFQIDHFELFGLKQSIQYFSRKTFHDPEFVTPWLYRIVRNPLMLGFLIGFWATPKTTSGHLFFSMMVTVYVLIGIQIEERSIAKKLGAPYVAYRKKTPMLIPLKF